MSAAVPPTPIEAATAAAAQPRRSRGGFFGSLGVLGTICLVIILFAALIAVFGAMLAPYDPNFSDLGLSYVGPTGGHLFGFDQSGRDILSRVMVGARTSLLGPLVVVAFAIALGTVIAVATAWKGGRFDTLASTGLDILFAFPGILLAVLAAAVFGRGLTAAALALSVAYMPYVARVVRSAAIRERNQQYIAALEVQGFSGFAVCMRHLVPNVLPIDRRPGHHPVRLRDGRPGRDLVHRPGRAAAAARLGRDGAGGPKRCAGQAIPPSLWPRASASSSLWWRSTCWVSVSSKTATRSVRCPTCPTCLRPAPSSCSRSRELSPVELMEAVLERADQIEPTVNAFAFRFDERARAQAAGGRGAVCRKRRGAAPAGRNPGGAEGRGGGRGRADDHGLADAQGRGRRSHHRGGRADRGGGRHHPRPHQHARVLVCRVHALPAERHHPQPVEPRVRRRRVVGRLGRVARGGYIAAGQRLGHRRLDSHPGVVQRRGRLQAAVWPRARGAAVQPRSVLPLRPARADGGRHRALRKRAGRAAPVRHRLDCAQARDPRSARRHRRAAAGPDAAAGRLPPRSRGRAKHARGRRGTRGRRGHGRGVRARADRADDQRGHLGALREHLRRLDRERRRGRAPTR